MDDKIEKGLKEKDKEETTRKDRMKNIILHGIDELEGTDLLERRAKYIKEVQSILDEFCEIELKHEEIVKSMHPGMIRKRKD